MDKNKFIFFLEWDGLYERYEITNDLHSDDDVDLQKIIVFRDEEYKIKATLNGYNNRINLHEKFHGKGIPGSTVNPIMISGKDKSELYNYQLSECYIGRVSHSTKLEGEYEEEFIADLSPYTIEKTNYQEDEVFILREWYINGPDSNFLFNKSTERIYLQEHTITRAGSSTEIKINSESRSLNRDHVFIELEDYKFIITKIPDGIGPSWSNNIGIEYRTEFGRIPEENEREGISEILSFLFGKQLLKVGYTEFNQMGHPLKQVSQNPWGDNVVSKSKKIGLSPVLIDDYYDNNIEEIFPNLISTYLELREDLNLKDSLWSLWVSENVPTGTNIPLIANAMEILKKGWFKSNKTKSKGVYLPKEKFEKLLEEDFKNINKKLLNEEFNDRMLRRIRNSYQMGANESLDFFFEEIGLSIGEVERKAIKFRNAMIHDKHGRTDKEIESIIFNSKVYKSLYSRVFLKLLNYDGDYTDYTLMNFPRKNINEITNNE